MTETARQTLLSTTLARVRWLAEGALCQVFPPPAIRPAPRISVVTPVLNNAATIRETIESVLGQASVELEYTVVDGGSTDGSVDIIREYAPRLTRFIAEPDRGMYDAIGKGFAHATGDVLAYLNADDVYENGALARVAEAFRNAPGAQVIYFEDSVTVDGWRFPNRMQPLVDYTALLAGHILYQDGVFFTRKAYEAVGGVNREMRLAGDWELWTRLAQRFPFRRMNGHVSSFRIRPGQLSQDMGAYEAEVNLHRPRISAEVGARRSLLRYPRHFWLKILNRIRWLTERLGSRRLFFPIDTSELPPPPGRAPQLSPTKPRCPIDCAFATDLLFSTRDTRFGDNRINYFYHHRETDVVSCYPPLGREEIKDLYAQNYNLKHPAIRLPDPGFGSPYRRYRSKLRLLRTLSRIELPLTIRRGMSRLGAFQWPDRSLEEIRAMLRGLGPARPGGRPRLLDVGCFDGKLLDRLAESGDWETFGLEPNAEAAQTARSKGHRVWIAEAEDAVSVVPPDTRFDIIFLGQTIEHLDDPLAVLIRLTQLLAEDGAIVLSTPNLDSAQIDLFGPTWSHWHAPYHRHLFSPKSLALLGECAGLKMVRHRTWSHPAWSWLSIHLHELGLGGAVPHGIDVPPQDVPRAESLAIFCRLFYDWRGKGDYVYACFKKRLE